LERTKKVLTRKICIGLPEEGSVDKATIDMEYFDVFAGGWKAYSEIIPQ